MTAAVIDFQSALIRKRTGQPLTERGNVVPISCPDIDRSARAVPVFSVRQWVKTPSGGVGMITALFTKYGAQWATVRAGQAIVHDYPVVQLRPNGGGSVA
jgi:hypothetical protein